MYKKSLIVFSLLAVIGLAACTNDDEYVQPEYRQELCLFTYHGTGARPTFITDSGRKYSVVTQGNFVSLKPDTAYRMNVIYTPLSDSVSADVAALAYIPMLGDSTRYTAASDTLTKVKSIWKGGGYINMVLHFMHDGSEVPKQTFGYRVDSVKTAGQDGRTASAHHLSFLYKTNDVPEYYTASLCFSLHPSSLDAQPGDTVIFHTVCKTKDANGHLTVDKDKISVIL